MYCYRYACVE